jgi:hypothetical protein
MRYQLTFVLFVAFLVYLGVLGFWGLGFGSWELTTPV